MKRGKGLCKGRSGGGGTASVATGLPAGVSVLSDGTGNPGTDSRTYSFGVDGVDVDMNVRYQPGQKLFEVDFQVDGLMDVSLRRQPITASQSNAIASKVTQIFRHDVSRRPDGTKFKTEAYSKDGRGRFREVSYARVGFSLGGGGTVSRPGSKQYGVVVNGRLTPATRSGKVFSATQQSELRQSVRNNMRQAIQEARGRQ